jgi:hypothetical protein
MGPARVVATVAAQAGCDGVAAAAAAAGGPTFDCACCHAGQTPAALAAAQWCPWDL